MTPLHFILLGGLLLIVTRPRRSSDEVGARGFGINQAIDAAQARARAKADADAARRRIAQSVARGVANAPRTAVAPKKKPSLPLSVFVHDAALVPVVLRAAARIEKASGIDIRVNERGSIRTSFPIFGSDFLCANGTDGRAFPGLGLGLARNCKVNPEKVAVHELLHMLGLGHLPLPARGIMNEAGDAPLDGISADDLKALCAVRTDCTRFVPEV